MALADVTTQAPRFAIKQPFNLSPRIKWLRDYYFPGGEPHLEERLVCLDHRNALGCAVQRSACITSSRKPSCC